MARFPIATGTIPNLPMTVIVDTGGKVQQVQIQNTSPVDVWYSEDPNKLQNILPGAVPTVGIHLWPDQNPPTIVVLQLFVGKLYARAQTAGAFLEVIQNDIEPKQCCNP